MASLPPGVPDLPAGPKAPRPPSGAWRILGSSLCLTLLMACPPRPDPGAQLAVRMGTDGFQGYDHVVVSIEKVEALTLSNQWIPINQAAHSTVDLMGLQNGQFLALGSYREEILMSYTSFRITWAQTNYQDGSLPAAYVVPTGGERQALAMPSNTLFPGAVHVMSNTTTWASLMLDGSQVIQLHAGAPTPYRFQATGRAFDSGSTSLIKGRIGQIQGEPVLGLGGVEVFAETLDDTGLATIRRRALTDATGSFTLEALPIGAQYWVVAQPSHPDQVFQAQVLPVHLNAAGRVYQQSLYFDQPQSPGRLDALLTPASATNQGTWIELRQSLLTSNDISRTFIVRSRTVSTGATTDQASFQGLAPGNYSVNAQRATADGAPVMSATSTQDVSASATTTVDLVYD